MLFNKFHCKWVSLYSTDCSTNCLSQRLFKTLSFVVSTLSCSTSFIALKFIVSERLFNKNTKLHFQCCTKIILQNILLHCVLKVSRNYITHQILSSENQNLNSGSDANQVLKKASLLYTLKFFLKQFYFLYFISNHAHMATILPLYP